MTTFERPRSCGKPAELTVLDEDAAGLLYRLNACASQPSATVTQWKELAHQFTLAFRGHTVTVDECPFSGDVEVTAHGQMGPSVRLTWKCPTCGHDHEEDGE